MSAFWTAFLVTAWFCARMAIVMCLAYGIVRLMEHLDYPYGGRNWVKCRTCNGTGEQPTVTYQTPGARSAAQVRHWKLMHHVTGEDFQPCADCLAYYGVTA